MQNNGRNFTTNILINNLGQQVSFTNSGTLTFTQVYFSSAIHGVPLTASSPFASAPIGFIPYYAVSGSQMIDISNYFFSSNIDRNQYCVEFNYDVQHTKPFIELWTANQVIPTNVDTILAFSFSWQPDLTLTAFSWNSATGQNITIREPGLYQLDAIVSYPVLAASGSMGIYCNRNGVRVAATEFSRGVGTFSNQIGVTCKIPLSASDVITVTAAQSVAATQTINGGNSQSNTTRFTLTRLYNYNSLTGSVSGILMGIA